MGGAPPAGLSSHMRPWASTLAILGVGLRGNRETCLTGSPQLPQEVPPPPAVSTRNSFLPLNVPEVPPTRRPRDSSVSQATTPRSTSGSLDPPLSRAKAEKFALSPRPHAHPCPPLGSFATSDRGGLAGGAVPATRLAAVSPPTEMTLLTEVGGALAPLRHKPRPLRPRHPTVPCSSDLHLLCCSMRLRPVGGSGFHAHRFSSFRVEV